MTPIQIIDPIFHKFCKAHKRLRITNIHRFEEEVWATGDIKQGMKMREEAFEVTFEIKDKSEYMRSYFECMRILTHNFHLGKPDTCMSGFTAWKFDSFHVSLDLKYPRDEVGQETQTISVYEYFYDDDEEKHEN